MNFTIRQDVPIRMRDGTMLRANLYVPAEGKRFATLVQLTPYTVDRTHRWASYFAQRGFAFAVVNCRGRGGSRGRFRPFHADGRDGTDAVEWAARQPWSDGRVAMCGGSYCGFTQWATAAEHPRHLVAIAPIASAYPGWDFPRLGGIMGTYVVRWLAFVHGSTASEALFSDVDFWKEWSRRALERHTPIGDLDRDFGTRFETLAEWLAHPDRDAYWQRLVPSPADYARIRIPVLSICGQYDGNAPGALRYYAEHRRYSGGPHDLLIGPWNHPGTREPSRRFSGLVFGPAAEISVKDLLCAWYRWALGEGPKPRLLEKGTAIYIAGEERWQRRKTLGDHAVSVPVLYAEAKRAATSLGISGRLQPRRPRPHVRSYSRDLHDIREGLIENEAKSGFAGNSRARGIRGTGLVFTSAPFARGMKLVGRPMLDAWLRIDQPDADFIAFFEEVRRGGRTLLLAEARLRARYRNGLEHPEEVTPGRWTRFRFETAHFIARQLRPGSRLRVVLTTPVSPFYERSGKPGTVMVELALGGARACKLHWMATALGRNRGNSRAARAHAR